MKRILILMVSVVMLLTNSFSQSIMLSKNFNSPVNTFFNDFSIPQSNVDTTGIDKSGKPFSVYPSPSSGPVLVSFEEPVKQIKFSVYNMIGNEIKNVSMEKLSDLQCRFNFRNQQPGFYFIRIQTDKYNYTTRITITAAVAQKPVAPNA